MDYGNRNGVDVPHCLECGDEIVYGRVDKKFCSEQCKNRHHNVYNNSVRNMKRRVVALIDKNYGILDELVRSGVDAVWLDEVVAMGFNPAYMTSFVKGRRHSRFSCYDINYIMTPGRISAITKIQNLSLNLQVGLKNEDQM